MLMVPNLRVVEPNNIYRKVPTRKPNAEMRAREYLTPAEVEKLIAVAKLGRHGHRDATLILEHVPPRLNRGILMRRRMGESIVIDSLLGAGQCRGLIPETCVSE